MASSLLAEIGVPTAGQCLRVLGPVAAFFLFRWILRHTDGAIRHLFPGWEWQRQLGWFNIRAERRANTTLRWLSYGIYAVLAIALYGIVFGAEGLSLLPQWHDPQALDQIESRLPVLVLSLGVWIFYFGWELMPKLRRGYEQEELERFRAEMAAAEQETAEDSSPARRPEIWSKAPLTHRPRQ